MFILQGVTKITRKINSNNGKIILPLNKLTQNNGKHHIHRKLSKLAKKSFFHYISQIEKLGFGFYFRQFLYPRQFLKNAMVEIIKLENIYFQQNTIVFNGNR